MPDICIKNDNDRFKYRNKIIRLLANNSYFLVNNMESTEGVLVDKRATQEYLYGVEQHSNLQFWKALLAILFYFGSVCASGNRSSKF
jgi:hypothetical protein